MRHIGYTNAGTVEFLMDENGDLYFIEVNARIQVEHPVTESVTGIDLVKSQIRIAAGETLAEIIRAARHHSRPRHRVPHQRRESGHLRAFARPHHRLESAGRRRHPRRYAAYKDGVIPPYYDSLVAKLIAYGHDRAEAIARMRRALELFVVEGIHTSIPLHQRIMKNPDFIAGKTDTTFLTKLGRSI